MPITGGKRTTSRHSCSFSICPCNEMNCQLKTTAGEPLKTIWSSFLATFDPMKRSLSRLQLCKCHFADSNYTKPVISPLEESALKMLRKRDEEVEKYKSALTSIFTDDMIRCLIDKKNHTYYKHETLIKSMDLYERIGMKNYQYLIQLGFPFPSDRTLRSFKAKIHDGVDDDVFQSVVFERSQLIYNSVLEGIGVEVIQSVNQESGQQGSELRESELQESELRDSELQGSELQGNVGIRDSESGHQLLGMRDSENQEPEVLDHSVSEEEIQGEDQGIGVHDMILVPPDDNADDSFQSEDDNPAQFVAVVTDEGHDGILSGGSDSGSIGVT